jgi:hypothetical protein
MAADEFDDDDRPARRPRNSRDDDDDRPARRHDQDDDFDDTPRKKPGGGNGLAITSLVLGIISLIMVCCCAYVSPLLGIGALITGFSGKSKGQSNGMCLAGIITGGLAILFSIILLILVFSGWIKPMDIREFQKK